MGARLEATGLTKSYGSVTVLDDVSISVQPGEVRALLGENGAGKSTLIKILAGVVRPDNAEIRLDGQEVDIGSPNAAIVAGVATLHQELSIVPGLSVAENVLLGENLPTKLGRVDWGQVSRRAQELFDELGHEINVRADVASLSPVGRTMTALARSLSRDSRVLILDEPTAALTDAETSLLFAAMKRLTAKGVSIIYVSHLLEEVVEVCQTYTVLRNGRLVDEGLIDDVTIDGLIASMAGRPIDAIFPERVGTPGEVVLTVEGLRGKRINDVSFELRRGEILGIAGLAGSGRSEVLRLLAGPQQAKGGSIRLNGEEINVSSVRQGHNLGIAMVPQERRSDGLVPDTIERNTNITTLGRHAFGSMVMSKRSTKDHAGRFATNMDLRYSGLDQQVLTLSGGNQQKVVLSKFLALDPEVLLLDEPTRGVDVATKSQIYRLIADRAADGKAIIMVSSELNEVLGLAHRVLVMHDGRLVETVSAEDTTEHDLLLACYGRE